MTEPRSRLRCSIVIVNFNYAAFLGQAIDSALAQTFPDCQVVVVDDKSTDGSRELITSYGDRITAVYRENNGGMSAAVNSGYSRSTGDIVLFLDADDFLYPHAVEHIVRVWSPDVAQVQARLHLVNVEGEIEDIFPAPEVRFDQGRVAKMLAERGRYSTTVTSGLAFSRAVLEAVMPIPEIEFDRSADGYLATVAPLYGKVAAIEQPIGAYRRHDTNHSGFQANIAKRARWRVDHDERRYRALRDHAARTGIAVGASPGMHDSVHLEQRLASLLFEPELHPYPLDRRMNLASAGARAAWITPMSAKRRSIYAAMFLFAGIAPRFLARLALAWKLERTSRPAIIDRAAGLLRRLMG
jgi:hypothetical protein